VKGAVARSLEGCVANAVLAAQRRHFVETKRENAMLEMPLTLAQAISIVNAAIDRARELGVNVSVAVCDRQGHLVTLHRMDNAVAMANEGSIGKALASAGTGLPSAQQVTTSMSQSSIDLIVGKGLPVIFVRGGLPVTQDHRILGACGVAGAPSNDQDEECARAGIDILRY
jgi:uncharacterized protein GlcG (DUF336 family)